MHRLSSTSTPAAKHVRLNSTNSGWNNLDLAPVVGNTTPSHSTGVNHDVAAATDEAIEKYLNTLRRNLQYKRAEGAVGLEELSDEIQLLESENKVLEMSCAADGRQRSPIVLDSDSLELNNISPGLDVAPFSRDSAVEPVWWGLKKRLNSFSLGRYSVATTRLSVAVGRSDATHSGVFGGRTSDWRRSIESIKIRSSSARENAVSSSDVVNDRIGNFIEFYTIGVDSSIFDGSREPEVDIFQPANALHAYHSTSVPCLIENISEFIFPGGKVPLYLHMGSQAADARTGPEYDQYQLMQFSDSSGNPTYACALIVTEFVSDPCAELVKNLNLVQTQLLAATIITKFFRGIVIFKKSLRYQKKKGSKVDPQLRRFSDYYMKPNKTASPAKSGGVFSSLSDMVYGMLALSKRRGQGQRMRTEGSGVGAELSPMRNREVVARAIDPAHLSRLMDDDSAVSETSSRSVSLSSDHMSEPLGRASFRKLSTESKISGIGADNTSSPRMMRSNSMKCIRSVGDELTAEAGGKWNDQCAVVTQRAYCIVSNNPFYAFLFKLLLEISAIYRSNGMTFANNAEAMCEYGMNVNSLLEVAQDVNLFKTLSPFQGMFNGQHGTTQLEGQLLESVSFSYKCGNKGIYQFNASLRSCSQKQFVLAVLFTFVPYSVLIEIINHTLLEKSLIVCGKLSSLVSIISTGVTYLLSPFQWDGVFVPMLPKSALEVLQAPVPFILGIYGILVV